MQLTGASIFTFNETHGDDLNPLTKNILRKSQHRIWTKQQGHSHVITSSSKAAVAGFTKPGGNMVGIIGNLCGRVREQIRDDYGRWCGFTILGKDGREILVLTIYNVSQDHTSGNNTLYRQQQALYLNDYNCNDITEDKATYIHPKKRFVKDLRLLLEAAKRKRQDILLTGDFNEDMGDNHNDLTQLMIEMDLVDIHAHTHGYDYEIATYTDGVRRLDYAFLSRRLIDHVVRCGYERFCMRLATDHRGYFVDLSLRGLFDRQLPSLFSPSMRHIRGNDPRNIRKYIIAFFNYIETHKLLLKAVELQHASNFDPKKAEQLDKLITAGMLAAERKCRIFYRLPWDKETHEVIMSKNIVKSLLTGMRRHIDLGEVLKQKMSKLKEPFALPTTITDCKALLSSLQRRERDLIKSRRANQATTEQAREQAFVAMHATKYGGTEQAKSIFAQKEATTRMMRSLPKSKKNGSGGITNVLVPLPTKSEELEWGSVTDRPDIERLILDCNIEHFSQAGETPLASNEIIDMLEFGGDTEMAQQILDGTAYIP